MTQRRALLSVSDKSGIVAFAERLLEGGFELLSTGGTARALREAGLAVTDVADITRHPEMMEGRVKTLHPAVHAGLLARRDRADDMQALVEQGYGPIDLVAVNLYPFRETIAQGGIDVEQAMAKVDIGGPTMIRAAAKNHRDVWVVVDPADYPAVADVVTSQEADDGALRRRLAAKVFRHISAYDAAVAGYLENDEAADLGFAVSAPGGRTLRYGENPDQEASFHPLGDRPDGVAALEQLHGKELSYNNLLDLDGALLALAPFAYSPQPAVAIIKHTTPCGLAVADRLADAYERALASDPVSAFGSVIAMNRVVDLDTAEAAARLFVECLVAPGFDDDALEVLTRKKNVRLLALPGIEAPLDAEPTEGRWAAAPELVKATGRMLAEHSRRPEARVFRSVYGGVLVQSPPVPPFFGVDGGDWTVATEREPTAEEWNDLRFAWAAIFAVKSNAILLAADGATLGVGAGQMSRVDASRIAVQKATDAGRDLAGCVLASDAFFPFRDGVDAAAAAGVRAIVQPGGSVRDEEVIEAANEHGIAMVFTARRLFRH